MKEYLICLNWKYLKQAIDLSLLLLSGCGSGEEALILYQSGMREFNSKKLTEAEKSFLAAIDKDSDLLNARLMLSKISCYNGNFSSALSFADSSLDEVPDHAAAL